MTGEYKWFCLKIRSANMNDYFTLSKVEKTVVK